MYEAVPAELDSRTSPSCGWTPQVYNRDSRTSPSCGWPPSSPEAREEPTKIQLQPQLKDVPEL
eukprot:4119078-Heterocapsa_arctica.AAC.1